MAEVSYLHLHEDEDNDRDDVVVTLDSVPYWSHDFDSFDVYASDPDALADFPPSASDPTLRPQISTVRIQGLDDISESVSITNVDFFDRENQVNFVMDLFHQRVEQSSSRVIVDSDLVSSDPNLDPNFGVIEGNEEMGSNNLELDLGLGLGFCMDKHGLADDDDNCGFMVADRGDEFFVSRRGSVSESGGSSTACGGTEHFIGGLRVVGIESDSDEDVNEAAGIVLNQEDDYGFDNERDDDTSLQICWDSFQLEDHRDANEDFEWEEVDGRVDEREVLSMFFDADADEDLDASVSAIMPSEEEMGVERVGALGNLEWEVLLNVHNLETNPELGHDGVPYLGDHDEYNYTAEYEMLFGQFAENENAFVGRPPASKIVVKNLPLMVLTQEDVENNNALCAVCKDEINIGEQAKQLPCSHRYHGDCIVPWLGIRNTCPVCRYELPTDDPDYERRRMRTQRAGRAW
uniref:RING-type E3 ubiquitin transferase n=2 Tax=Davidia involucrata TaxID=16924 RepID=A0A5B7AV51_DAVIN